MSNRKIDINISGGLANIGNISHGDNNYFLHNVPMDSEKMIIDNNLDRFNTQHNDYSRLSEFDAFLCHNSKDKPSVREVNSALRDGGVITWLDEEQLSLGLPWQDELEKHISEIRCALVFVGSDGLGTWQKIEIRTLLDQLLKKGCPVIPVILRDATDVHVPLFLQQLTWIDLRSNYEKNIRRLIGEIKDIRKQ